MMDLAREEIMHTHRCINKIKELSAVQNILPQRCYSCLNGINDLACLGRFALCVKMASHRCTKQINHLTKNLCEGAPTGTLCKSTT